MSDELPHALLRCPVCSTGFRVTLKKGRVPSRPIPCPKCKAPITVLESDVRGGRKAAPAAATDGILRQTKVADSLRKTRVGPAEKSASSVDPAPAPAPSAPEQPATASAQADGTARFGVVMHKRVRAHGPEERSGGATLSAPGVQILKGEGSAARDRVFAPREGLASSEGHDGVAIGRIKIARVTASSVHVAADDPDLPVPSSVRDSEASWDSEEIEMPESGAPSSDASETTGENVSKPRISLDRLKLAIKKLDAEQAAEESEGLELSENPESLFDGAEMIEVSEASEFEFDEMSEVEDVDIDVNLEVHPPTTSNPTPLESASIDTASNLETTPEQKALDDEGELSDARLDPGQDAAQSAEPPQHNFPWSLVFVLIVLFAIGGITLLVASL